MRLLSSADFAAGLRQQAHASRARRRTASADWTVATERALPCPPAAGISARRHGISHDCSADERRVATACARRCSRIGALERQRWRRDHLRDAVVVLRRRADVEVGAERSRDLLREERADRLAGDPAHDLADEVALRDRVVAGRRARLPPRLLRGEQRGAPCPSRRGPRGCIGCCQPDRPALWLKRWRTSTPSLPPSANSGQ